MREALDLVAWVQKRQLESGVLAEQVHPYTGAPMSVAPLTWSHATVVATVREYLAKLEQICELESKRLLLADDVDILAPMTRKNKK